MPHVAGRPCVETGVEFFWRMLCFDRGWPAHEKKTTQIYNYSFFKRIRMKNWSFVFALLSLRLCFKAPRASLTPMQALAARGTITAVGRRLGVGKPSMRDLMRRRGSF